MKYHVFVFAVVLTDLLEAMHCLRDKFGIKSHCQCTGKQASQSNKFPAMNGVSQVRPHSPNSSQYSKAVSGWGTWGDRSLGSPLNHVLRHSQFHLTYWADTSVLFICIPLQPNIISVNTAELTAAQPFTSHLGLEGNDVICHKDLDVTVNVYIQLPEQSCSHGCTVDITRQPRVIRGFYADWVWIREIWYRK